ncbi:MAG: ATP-binding protein [Candidatus Parabeggiatoa sp.]|nr:ATP-binding protein [Candidatus Parabeggiatoa sp.]
MKKPAIICVDDENIILVQLQMELMDALGDEYLIETAEGGEDALALFNELLEDNYEIPLVISDCIMLDMAGQELLKCIHAISPKTFKILLTGQTSTEAVIDAVNHANLYRYIAKPWEKEDLILTVKQAIESYLKDQLLEEQNRALKEMNTQLQKRTKELLQALKELKAMQQELIDAEKMATLGQLVAGIAHEINTPLGAIQSSVENITDFLNQTINKLPDFFKSLSSKHQQDFFALLKYSTQEKHNLSSKEKRQYRRALVRQLEEHNIENATTIADTLVDMGIYEDIETFLPLLPQPESHSILKMAYQMGALQKSARTITMASNRAAKVVFALNNFAHYDHQGKKIKTNITENIETVLTLYHNKSTHNIKVIKNYAELPPVLCYPDELNQVWTNLIHNALQAMNNKGTLQLEVARQDNYAVISIIDSGQGIADEIKDKIFVPFFTTKAIGEGSGLGLDIVKKIIEKHDGKIEFQSLPGKTRFTVSIPINSNEEA